jgi:hypothetical protein
MPTPIIEHVCDSCESMPGPFRISARVINHPERPQMQCLSVVMRATKQPPTKWADVGGVQCEMPNPDYDAEDLMDVRRMTDETCLCSEACFRAFMEKFWAVGFERAKRFWTTGEKNWK